MAETTIEWTATTRPDGTKLPGYTFNPWICCTKVHEGCKHCYAETMMDSRYGKAKWGPQGTRVMTSDANWRKPIQWNREAEKSGVRSKVFCASLADVFEDWKGHIDDARNRLFDLIDATPHLDWLLLTKRPENIRTMWPDEKRRDNVWLGTSISTQEHADKQVPELLKCQHLAAKLFLSIEPMLGPIDLRRIVLEKSDRPERNKPDLSFNSLKGWYGGSNPDGPSRIDWVIVGGESGHGARPVHPEWVRSIRDQCVEAGVPFFFKQWGELVSLGQYPECEHRRNMGTNPGFCRINKHGLPDPSGDVTVYKFGKKAAGRLLDGVEWNQLPASLKEVPHV